MVPEKLESRALFSASVTATQTPSGNLTVMGTDGTDSIEVVESTLEEGNEFGVPAGPIVFVIDHVADVPLTPENDLPFFQGVKHLRIVGKGGDDTIVFSGVHLDATIQGDDGVDDITVQYDPDPLANSDGSSVVYGGRGNDRIHIGYGLNNVAFGGTGDDEFNAELGIYSSSSATLFGNAGDDIFTVSGNVVAVGGAGYDRAFVATADNQPILLVDLIVQT